MYLSSLRLPPSPWVGTRCSATAQYTVPSVSTQTMTPRRVGFLNCACAPPRADPAGPSVWCTMMLRQGWALATSPQGASQTIFKPGISGVPDDRASMARSGVWADAGNGNARAKSAVARRRRFIREDPVTLLCVARPCFLFDAFSSREPVPTSLENASGALAQHLSRRHGEFDLGHQRRRRLVGGKAIPAALLGVVKRVVGGRDQAVGEHAHLPGPLRTPDRDRDRDILARAFLGIRTADIHHAA